MTASPISKFNLRVHYVTEHTADYTVYAADLSQAKAIAERLFCEAYAEDCKFVGVEEAKP